jgi:signal transduction histidine kinase
MNFGLYVILYSAAIVGFFVVALLVHLRQKGVVHRSFAVTSFLVGIWQLLEFISQFINNHTASVILLKSGVAASVFTAAFFLLFALAYVGSRARLLIPLMMISTLVGLVTFFSSSLQEARIGHEGIAVSSIDIYYGIPLLFALIFSFSGVALIIWHFKDVRNRAQRAQDLILFTGTLLCAGIILIFSVFAHGSLTTQISVPIASFVAVAAFAYAIIYQGLFDIQFFVIRSATYLATFFVITVIFVTPTVLILCRVLGYKPNTLTSIIIIFSSVAGIYLLQYLRRIFDTFTNRIFYRFYYDAQDVIEKLSSVLARTIDVGILKEQSGTIIEKALKPSFLKYLLISTNNHEESKIIKRLLDYSYNLIVIDELSSKHSSLIKILRENEIAIAIKLNTPHEDLGFMVLGYKLSGEEYTDRDKRLLKTVAGEIAISLQNALRFEKIQSFNVTLQDRIDHATSQLRRTNQRLEELDESKDDFISMASHQLRTPLTSVKGYLSMVLEGDAGKVNSTQTKMLHQAFSSSQRMVFLITDLLNVSRIKTGKFVIESTPVDLSKLVEEEVAQLIETAQIKNIKLTYDKPAVFPVLMLDETKTRQVGMNFIDNAIYYTPAGGNIKVELVDKPTTVELRVIDDGMGVPKAEQHHLFTKFYRATNARKARPDGTGLGLFMARKVIAAEGGSIIFESKEGHGSTFGFVFSKAKLKLPTQPPNDKENTGTEAKANAPTKSLTLVR